ncbi:MAG: methyl-accepting chemotaxis protein [Eubacterium sp.]|nr:methyl-accepting chemotaxis protein [Eubacterium sp.]
MKKSIKTRVVFYMIIILVVSIITVSLTVSYNTVKIIEDEKKDTLQLQADKYSKEIEVWMTAKRSILHSLADALSAMEVSDDESINLMLQKFQEKQYDMHVVYAAKPDKSYYRAADYDVEIEEGYDPTQRPWYQMAVEAGDAVIVDPYADIFTGEMCMTIACPVYVDEELVMVVAGDIGLSTVLETVNLVAADEGGYGFIIDSAGDIVTHPNDAYEPTSDTKINAYDVMPELSEIFDETGANVLVDKDYAGEKMFFASSQILGSEWELISVMPTSVVFDDMITIILVILGLSVLCMIVAAIVATIRVERELEPIKPIAAAVQRLSEGDFSSQLGFSMRQDELGTLQNSMSNLVGILSAIIEQERYILDEMAKGDLAVVDMEDMPGTFDEIADCVNHIKRTLNELIKDIQYTAIELQDTAMGFGAAATQEEMEIISAELSALAMEMMEKANKFNTSK